MTAIGETGSLQARRRPAEGLFEPARGSAAPGGEHQRASRLGTVAAPGTSTDTDTAVRPSTDDGDHDRFAHYTRRTDANRAYIEGTPLRALCGKVWVPSRDPSRYPVCPQCEKIRQQLRNRIRN